MLRSQALSQSPDVLFNPNEAVSRTVSDHDDFQPHTRLVLHSSVRQRGRDRGQGGRGGGGRGEMLLRIPLDYYQEKGNN